METRYMIDRSFIVKKTEIFSEHIAKNFVWKFLTTEESLKNWNDFTQLWRQRPCLLKVKIHLTSYGFSHCQSYTDFDIKLDGFIRKLAWTYEVKNFWFGVYMVADVITDRNHSDFLRFFGDGSEFSSKCVQKNFSHFYNKISANQFLSFS